MTRRSLPLVLLLLAWAMPLRAQFPPELRGRVTERGSGAPIPGATIEVVGGGLRATSGTDGGFRLRGLLPGEREVRVRAFGFRTGTLTVRAENGRSLWLPVTLEPDALALEEIRAVAERDEAGATVLDRTAIEASGARELGELLRDQAGVTVTRRGGPGAPATVSIRGSSADEVLVLVDGVPVNSLLTGEADLSTVPLEAVGRVTVLRGARSARYGGRALAGVIRVETRRPAAPEADARLASGSWGERRAAASAGTRGGVGRTALGGLVAADWQRVGGDFRYAVPQVVGGGEAVRRNADASTWSVLATGSLEARGTEVRARGEALGVERGMPGSIVQSTTTARQAQRRLSGGVSAAGRGWGSGDWTLALDAARQTADYRDPTPPFGAPYDESVEVGSAGVTASAGADVGPIALDAGAEARGIRFASTMLAEGAPGGQTLLGAWLGGRWERDLPGGTRLELLPAARADRNTLLDRTFLSPRLGVSLGTSRWTARGSVGSAYSPPSLADQFFQEGVMARPNPDLRPERVRMEIEGIVEARDLPLGPARVDAELAAYRADVDGMILWSPDHRFVWSPGNFDVRRAGWEAALRARFPATELRAEAARAAVEYDTPVLAGQVVYRPRWTASGGVAHTARGVRAELAGRYVGGRRTVESPRLNRLPPYALVDARLVRPWSAGAWGGEIALSAENLLDRDAAMLPDYPYPRRSWGMSLRLRHEPRRAPAPAAPFPHHP